MYPFTEKTYQFLKWSAMVSIPAITAFVGVVGRTLEWQHTESAVIIIAAFGAFVGALTGVSSAIYTAGHKPEKDEDNHA